MLGKAESEFGLRLSSLGIQPEVDTGKSEALPRRSRLTETSASMPQRPLGDVSQ